MAYGDSLKVCVTLSDSGNIERDTGDAALWAELKARIEELASGPRYSDIRPMVF